MVCYDGQNDEALAAQQVTKEQNTMTKKTGFLLLLLAWTTWPVAGQPAPKSTTSQKPTTESATYHEVVLTRRKNNGPYETSAYSFRHQTQDLGLHRNNVDVVFNGCGQLHINPHAGLQGGIADVGKADLDKIKLADVKKVPRQAWRRFCLPPKDGHVYIHEGHYLNQRFTVAFKIKTITPDKLGIQWTFLGDGADEETEYRYTGAGTMGQCGGQHREQ